MTAEGAGPMRPLPELDELNRPFWTGGADGRLRMQRCASCGRLVHPPAVRCPHDGAEDLAWSTVSGRATVETFTVNEKTWFPGFDAPYIVALVALEEDPRTRVLTNLVGVDPDDVGCDLPVEVVFEHVAAPDDGDDVWIPQFRPREAPA